MPRSLKTPPAKPQLISNSKPAGSFLDRVLGTKKGPVTTPQGTRGHMSKPKKEQDAKYKDAAKRRLGQMQKDF